MKQGWEIKKLGECFEYIKNGANIKQERGAGGIPITRIETLSGGVFNRDRLGYADIETIDKYHSYVMESGDLLLSHINSKSYIGRVVVYVKEGDETIIHGMNLLRLKVVSNLISPFYMYYYSQTHKFKSQIANRRKDAVNQSSISVADLKTIDVPIPSLEEQERIVAELDCLSEVIEKKREQLKELDALAQSIFYQMFGDPNNSIYETRNLSDLSEHKLSYGSGASAVDFDGKIRYVRITDIKDDGELQDDKVSPNVFDDKYTLNDGDILFARSGATVGKTYQYKQKDGKAIYAGYLIRFIPNRNIVLPSYIFGYTKTNYYKAFISASAQAVAQPNINAQQFGALKVPIPPLTLQQEFAEKIEAIEKQKELIKQSITETEELFNSRMDYYFN